MNSNKELILCCLIKSILCCLIKSKEYFDEIDDFANVSSIIFQYLKPTPEYSLETNIFKRFFVRNFLVWTSGYEDIFIVWKFFLEKMKESPKGKFRDKNDDLNCSCVYILEYLYIYDHDDDYLSQLKTFKTAYNILRITNKPRYYINEAIILTRFLKKNVEKYKNLSLNIKNNVSNRTTSL